MSITPVLMRICESKMCSPWCSYPNSFRFLSFSCLLLMPMHKYRQENDKSPHFSWHRSIWHPSFCHSPGDFHTHSRELLLTCAHSRTCWCTHIDGKWQKSITYIIISIWKSANTLQNYLLPFRKQLIQWKYLAILNVCTNCDESIYPAFTLYMVKLRNDR